MSRLSGDRLTELVEQLLVLLVRRQGRGQRRRVSLWRPLWRPLCVHSGRNPIPIDKSRLLYVVCQSRRRNSGLLVPVAMDRRPGSGMGASSVAGVGDVASVVDVARVVDVAGTLFLLIAFQAAPKPKKYQDEKDATADSAADDRPWRV